MVQQLMKPVSCNQTDPAASDTEGHSTFDASPWCRRYNSTTYYDDLMWAATWMYQATRQPAYLTDAISFYIEHTQVSTCALTVLRAHPAHTDAPTCTICGFRGVVDVLVAAELGKRGRLYLAFCRSSKRNLLIQGPTSDDADMSLK